LDVHMRMWNAVYPYRKGRDLKIAGEARVRMPTLQAGG
jgi:hypothetical protein